jgi:hypothetical protein
MGDHKPHALNYARPQRKRPFVWPRAYRIAAAIMFVLFCFFVLILSYRS